MVIITKQTTNNDSVLLKTIIHKLKNESGLAKQENQEALKAFSELIHYRAELKENSPKGSFLKKDNLALLNNTKKKLKEFLIGQLWYDSVFFNRPRGGVSYPNLTGTMMKALEETLTDQLLEEVLEEGVLNDNNYCVIGLTIQNGLKEYSLTNGYNYKELLNAFGLELLEVDSLEEQRGLIAMNDYPIDTLFIHNYGNYPESYDRLISLRLPRKDSVDWFNNYFLFNPTKERVELLKKLYGKELKPSELFGLLTIITTPYNVKDSTESYYGGRQWLLSSVLTREPNNKRFVDYSELTVHKLLREGLLPKAIPTEQAVFIIESLMKTNYGFYWMRNDYESAIRVIQGMSDNSSIMPTELSSVIKETELIQKDYDLMTELLARLFGVWVSDDRFVTDHLDRNNDSIRRELNALAFYGVLPLTHGKQREELLSALETELVFSYSNDNGVIVINSAAIDVNETLARNSSQKRAYFDKNYKAWRLYEYFSQQEGVKSIVFKDPELSFVNRLVKKDAFYRLMLFSNASVYTSSQGNALRKFYEQLVDYLNVFNDYPLLYNEKDREYVLNSIILLKENLDKTEQALLNFLKTAKYGVSYYYSHEREKKEAIQLLERY